jgi:hypothetical protein
MNKKEEKFWQLFKQESIIQYFNTRFEIDTLLALLSDNEVDILFQKNTLFISCYSPSSKVELTGLITEPFYNLITVDQNYYNELTAHEFVGILLHEIGHVLNQVKGLEGEYAADIFATIKGYGGSIISTLQKGLRKKWIGFEQNICDLRIANITKYLNENNVKYDL